MAFCKAATKLAWPDVSLNGLSFAILSYMSWLPAIVVLIGLSHTSSWAFDRPNPLRQGVDVYNALGSSSRLLAFMKIGRSAPDTRAVNLYSAQLGYAQLPKAFLAGGSVYFSGLQHPLRVVDVRKGRFSWAEQNINLKNNMSLKKELENLNSVILRSKRRSSAFFILIHWIFPEAFADQSNFEVLAASVLAVAGLASASDCWNAGIKNCETHFMGALAALGAVGGIRQQQTTRQIFCLPDLRGQPQLLIHAHKHRLVALTTARDGEIWSEHNGVREPVNQATAARALLKGCIKKSDLDAINVALSYPPHAVASTVKTKVNPKPTDERTKGVNDTNPAAAREGLFMYRLVPSPMEEESSGGAR